MKKWLFFSLALMLHIAATAQTPLYFKGTGTSTNTIPMNTTASRCQQLYQPADFNILPIPGLITKIYFRNSVAGATGTFTNFKVAFLQNGLAAFANTSFLTGPVTALTAPSFTVTGNATAGGWYEIPLTTPYLYDNTQTLIVEISYTAKTGGLSGYTTTATGNKRLSSTVSNTATTGTLSTLWGDFGMEVIPATPCVNPPVAGVSTVAPTGSLCGGTTINLNLSGNTIGAGQTYEWESSVSNTPFVPVSLGAPAAIANFNTTVTATTWYRAKIVCGSNPPVYSTPVQVMVNPAFPGGTYTINNTLPTAGANFNSFADAVAALNCGIAGPIVFNVMPGTPYAENLSIGNIAGTSPVNTIRFNGNGAVLQFTNTSTNRQMLTLAGTKYVTLDSLTFKTLAADYGWAALITQGAARDSIVRCTFDLSSITATASGNSSGICFSASPTSAISTGANGSHCYIGHNLVQGPQGAGGPYYALPLVGACDSNVIVGNEILNFYFYGIYLNGTTGTIVAGNNIHRSTKTNTTTFYGIYTTGTVAGTKIYANRIHDPVAATATATAGFNGLYLLGEGIAADPCLVFNNAVYNINSSGTLNGIYMSAAPYVEVLHNTVNIDKVLSGTSVNYGIYATGTNTNMAIRNNNVCITAGSGGIKYGFYYSTAPSVGDAQRNNFYVNSTQAGAQYYGYYTTPYPDQTSFQTAYPLLETGSPAVDPQFSNPAAGDLVPGNYALFGTGQNLSALVSADILGNPRPLTPTVGAFEIPATGINNAGTIALITPSGSFCSGQQAVNVSINNGGSNNINTLQIHWTINGIPQTPVTYNGLLTPITSTTGQNVDTVSLGLSSFAPGVPATIKAWTYLPNNATDAENGNDTLLATIQPSAFSLTANLDTICTGATAYVALQPATGYATGQLLWQSSVNGSTWTDILNTDTVKHAAALVADTWYRVRIAGGVNNCYSDSLKIAVADPQLLNAPDTGHCGPGEVSLYATASANATVRWYESATATTPLAYGSPFVTPYIAVNTSYFVSADIGSAQPAPAFAGSGTTTTTTTYSPFYASSQSQKAQYLVKASELVALGFNPGQITSIGFDVLASSTTAPLSDFTVKLKSGNFTNLSTTWEPGMTTVFTTPAYSITPLSVNQFVLPVPFAWNGIDDIIVETCYQNTAAPTGTSAVRYTSAVGFTASHYLYTNNANNCSSPGTGFTTTARPNIQFGMSSSCESARQEVLATIYPVPGVDLGPDAAICGDENQTATLDAGNPGAVYLWDDGSVAQIRVIDNSGAYHVTVTNIFGCSQTDSVLIELIESPVVDLGNDTNVCEGALLGLDAGNPGMDHFWNTGVGGQQLVVDEAGSYSVIVTSAGGCMAFDTIQVTMNGSLPAFDGMASTNDGMLTYTFSVIDPVNVIAYRWDFGDGSPVSTDPSPVHTYPAEGIYVVKLELFSSCGSIVDTQASNIVGIAQLTVDPAILGLYPNPARSTVSIFNHSRLPMEDITISDMLGKIIYHSRPDSAFGHELRLTGFTPGLYQVQIRTTHGRVTRKLQIMH